MIKIDDLIDKNFKCEDVILIYSVRPERLFTQIKSFVDKQIEFVLKKRKAIIKNKARNKIFRNQRYIIVGDDINANEGYYLNEINEEKARRVAAQIFNLWYENLKSFNKLREFASSIGGRF